MKSFAFSRRKAARRFLPVLLALMLAGCAGRITDMPAVQDFIGYMAASHGFDRNQLEHVLAEVKIQEKILTAIAKPAENRPWHEYRKIFMTRDRVDEGMRFWRRHEAVLAAVERRYGVPPEVVVAILGIETFYGRHIGNYRVIDALATLTFAYPPRSGFFRSELENFLLLCRDEHIDPLQPLGSYAGAMGLPQFMPSSFRRYAVDFDQDNKRDIWRDPADAAASIGHYLALYGWRKDSPVAILLSASEQNSDAPKDDFKPNLRIDALQSAVGNLSRLVPVTTKVKILGLKQEHGEELWATLDNFYVITRYNRSSLYAMAVHELSQALSTQLSSSHYE